MPLDGYSELRVLIGGVQPKTKGLKLSGVNRGYVPMIVTFDDKRLIFVLLVPIPTVIWTSQA